MPALGGLSLSHWTREVPINQFYSFTCWRQIVHACTLTLDSAFVTFFGQWDVSQCGIGRGFRLVCRAGLALLSCTLTPLWGGHVMVILLVSEGWQTCWADLVSICRKIRFWTPSCGFFLLVLYGECVCMWTCVWERNSRHKLREKEVGEEEKKRERREIKEKRKGKVGREDLRPEVHRPCLIHLLCSQSLVEAPTYWWQINALSQQFSKFKKHLLRTVMHMWLGYIYPVTQKKSFLCYKTSSCILVTRSPYIYVYIDTYIV